MLDESIPLNELSCFVGGVTDEEEVVSRRDFPRESHEEKRVEGESRRHLAGNILGVLWVTIRIQADK